MVLVVVLKQGVGPKASLGVGLSLLLCHMRGHFCKPHCKSFQDSDALPTSQQLWTYHSGHPGCLQLCSFFCKIAPIPLKKTSIELKQKGTKQLDEQNLKLDLANTDAGYSHDLPLVL